MLADKYQLLAAFNASANAPPINLASLQALSYLKITTDLMSAEDNGHSLIFVTGGVDNMFAPVRLKSCSMRLGPVTEC